MKITLAVLAVSSVLASIADAQTRYWMRERIVGMPIASTTPPSTPTPTATPPAYTYSASPGAWSACIDDGQGGLQTRDVNCKRSDGAAAEDSQCPTFPAQQSCTMANRCILNSKTGVMNGGSYAEVGSGIYSTTDAKRACTAYMNRNSLSNGYCVHYMTSGQPSYGSVGYYGTGKTYSITSSAVVYAGSCT